MTQKELLYVEDAINHEKNIITICEQSMEFLEDSKLVAFFTNAVKKHQANQERLLNMLEDKANE